MRKCEYWLFITIFVPLSRQYFRQCFADVSPNADIQISAISAQKLFADSRYADIEKKCRYADIADADINIGTPLVVGTVSLEAQLSLLQRGRTTYFYFCGGGGNP